MEKALNKKQHLCKINYDSLPLVSEAYYMVALKHVVHPDRVADFNVLIYLISGSMEIIEDGTVYELKENMVFFLKSGVHHWGVKEYGVGTQWYYVHFYSSDIDDNHDLLNSNKFFEDSRRYSPDDYNCYIELPKIITLPSQNEIKDKLAHLVNKFQSCSAQNIIFLNIELIKILMKIYEIEHDNTDESKVDRRVEKVKKYIRNNYQRNFSSQEIAEEAGLSYKYISTLFKEKSGMTIKEYQLKMRLNQAERLLCETNCTVADIALQLGFYDAFSFSRIFKRENGVSPRKFRKDYIPRI